MALSATHKPFEHPGRITTRTFLGETWDYTFDSDSGLRLRIASPPAVTLQINQPVWLRIDQRISSGLKSRRQQL